MRTESLILADVMDKTRQVSLFYFSQLQGKDLHKIFDSEGIKLNNAFWIIAHLAVTENFLLLRSTGGEIIKFGWAKQFGIGSTVPEKADCPPLKEVLETSQLVHQRSIDHIRSLTDEDLNKPTSTGVNFGGEDTVRSIIIHAIRHEGIHSGHLSWLCKLHGVKTI
ncbi:MAG: DinB family protein [Flavobacteriales bacterium]